MTDGNSGDGIVTAGRVIVKRCIVQNNESWSVCKDYKDHFIAMGCIYYTGFDLDECIKPILGNELHLTEEDFKI